MDSDILVLATGFLAQGFFSARTLVQWILSERARHVLSPAVFWILSLAGSYLLCLYGWLRDDFSIVFGQFLTYYIYIWNLKVKQLWCRMARPLRVLLLLTPLVMAGYAAFHGGDFVARFLDNGDIPLWLLLFGTSGQLLFVFRFVYQWQYSRRVGRSCLPAGFWLVSLSGSLMIVVYAFIRMDIVLIVGQSFGAVAYTRNLILIHNERRVE